MASSIKQFIGKIILTHKTIKNIGLFALDYFGLINEDAVYCIKNNPAKMIARGGTNDKSEIAVVFSGHEYDLSLLPLMSDPIIVDLGGHIGSFSIYVSYCFQNKFSRLIVLEPSANNFQYLKRNFALNNLRDDRIIAVPAAIGAVDGEAELDTSKDGDGYFVADDNIMRNLSRTSSERCRVYSWSKFVVEYALQRIDILKIDIEGSEYRLFADRAFLEYITNNVRVILLEVHDLDEVNNRAFIRKATESNFKLIERDNIFYLFNIMLR